MTIRFRKGTSSVPGSSNYTYWANYGTSGSNNGTGTNGNISGGSFEPSAGVTIQWRLVALKT